MVVLPVDVLLFSSQIVQAIVVHDDANIGAHGAAGDCAVKKTVP